MSGDGDLDRVTEYRVQWFCWDELPGAWDQDVEQQWEVAQSLAFLLDEVGLSTYADLARSERTRQILEEAQDDDEGAETAFRAAVDASGIAPPDTDLLSWHTPMGLPALLTHERVANTLELARRTGEFTPGTRGSAPVRRRTNDAVLGQPLEGTEIPALTAILFDRFTMWADVGASPLRRALLEPLMDDVLDASAIDGVDVSAPVARLSWLVQACREPQPLTAAGYLKPDVVRAFVAEHDPFEREYGKGNREVNSLALTYTRQVAQELGLVRRYRGSLRTTRAGAAAATDPDSLAAFIARRWLTRSGPALQRQCRELVVVSSIGYAGRDSGQLIRYIEEQVVPVLQEMGWRRSGSNKLNAQDLGGALWEPYRELVHTGMLRSGLEFGSPKIAPGTRELLQEFLRMMLAHQDPVTYLHPG